MADGTVLPRRASPAPASPASTSYAGSGRLHRLYSWLALLFILLLPCSAVRAEDPWAPFDAPWFDRLGINDGLPHSIATAIVQDQRGLLWVGTIGGLVRYDGYRMQVFSVAAGGRSGLPDAYVRSLLALQDGGVLIGTNAGGLSRFDPVSNTLRNYPIGRGGTSDRKIYALAHDRDNGVWIATDHGLDYLDLRTNRIVPVATGDDASPRNFSVLQDDAGNLWLGNSKGLFFRRAGSHAFVRPPRPDGSIDTVLSDGIWAIREDREGRLWVGSTQAGAAYRDTDGHWQGVPGFSGFEQDHARRATVRDFLEISADTLWIGTDGTGVLAYSPGAAGVRAITHDTAVPSSLPGDSVRALMQDRSGNVWAATDLGIARHDPNARTAFALQPSARTDRAIANTNVRGIYVDKRQRIWLGMSSGRIDVIDLGKGQIRHLQLGGNQARRDVQAFAEGPDGTIWIGTQGLARVDPDTFVLQDSLLAELDEKPVLSLLSDGEQLLIATYDGVYRYNTHTHAVVHFRHAPNDPGSLSSDTVRHIAAVDHTIWYLTAYGISIAANPLQTRDFTRVLNRPGDPTSLPNDLVTSMATDPEGQQWIGTAGGLSLLEQWDKQGTFRFRHIGSAEGLASDSVNAVMSDDNGNLWVSLPNGVAMIDGSTHTVRNLGIRDGLRIASYIYAAAARAPTGELLFGGLGGLTVIRPDWRPPNTPDPPLIATQVELNGVPMPFGKLPRAGESLKLGPHSRSLRVDFALLDYQAPSETAYSYRMEGFDETWSEVPRGSLPSAIYTNLPYGEYTLHLRATTRGMQPRRIETTFQVLAEPRWYETVTARVIAILLLLAVMVGLIQLRTLYLQRKARLLQQQIDMHTRDLRAANLRLDELANTDELTGACNRRRFFALAEEVRQAAPDGGACIALLDLDHFKQINDGHGHLAGDAVIRAACAAILQQCREDDLVGRYGGEELVICLPGGTLAQGMAVAERIRLAVAEQHAVHEGRPIAVTASIGVAAYRAGESLSQWLSRADEALYQAKHAGRNRCVAAL
ncbi:ligand-binding sensor domain-containing diguanylate cyclase [Dyella halodurans]|uniref:diguanylate cyclase n=1 Tax=Dyella halodurans TaxID=1920171 RepID=A0ABV9C2E4_9GAMM|nr:ligand-binding sensor domain-containing diguanylate cyclase [Dyella halodurans]